MKRRVAIALVLLVAALAAWRLARLSEPLPGAPVLSPSSSATVSERDETLQIPSDVDASLPDADSRVVAARERSETGAASRVAPRFVADARLAVRAVADATGDPLGGVMLRLEPLFADASERAAARARGAFWRVQSKTDVDGLAQFDAPSGLALRVEAESTHTLPGMVDVSPIAPGAHPEVEIRLEPLGDFVLRGVLLDAETRRSVPFGVLATESTGESAARFFASPSGRPMAQLPSVRAGADGRFSLRGMSGRRANVRAIASGYAPTWFALERRFAERPEPYEVLLRRGATLDVSVVDAGFAPIAGALVGIADGSSGPAPGPRQVGLMLPLESGTWAVANDRGQCVLEGLVPGTPLLITAHATGFPACAHPESVVLAPGERRSVTVRIGRGATIVGRVIDERGEAVAAVEVCLFASAMPPLVDRTPEIAALNFGRRILDESGGFLVEEMPSRRRHTGIDSGQWAGRTITDKSGEFLLENVPAGRWHVGTDPERPLNLDGQGGPYAPAVQAVLVRPEDAELEVELRLMPGLYLRGIVVDADHRPQPGCRVVAERLDGSEELEAWCGSDGSFSIGPLLAGPWRVSVRGSGPDGAVLSEWLTADAGRSDLVLELRHGGSISGSIADADGRAWFPCLVTLARHGSGEVLETGADPRFTFRGLEPGTYVARAYDFTGRSAASAVVRLEGSEPRDGVRLQLRPAGRLRVWNARPGPARRFEVLAGGDWVDAHQASETVPAELVLPLGDYTVEWEAGGERRSKSVRVTAEKAAELELEGDP